MKISNLELAEDLVGCLEEFYSVDVNGLKKLPKELEKYSGVIHVALTEATQLRDNLKE